VESLFTELARSVLERKKVAFRREVSFSGGELGGGVELVTPTEETSQTHADTSFQILQRLSTRRKTKKKKKNKVNSEERKDINPSTCCQVS